MIASHKRLIVTRTLQLGAALAAFAASSHAAETYSQVILADNPVAYYRLEEPAGEITASDSSATGSFPGSYFTTDGVYPRLEQPGIDVNSAYFRSYKDESGTVQSSYVEIPYAAELNPTGAFSVEGWVRAMSASAEGEYRSPLGNFEGFVADNPGWFFYQSPEAAGNPSVWIWVMKGGGIWIQGGAIKKGEWEHLAAVYDGTSVSFYVNATLIGSAPVPGYVASSTKSTYIGAGPVGGWLFDGNVDEVAIYGGTLTAAQIQKHYEVGLASFRAGEVAPEITANPAAATVHAGREVKFTVGADGTAPLSYQWYQGGAAIAGATNDTLVFSCVPGDNGATYKVTVSNSFGSATSVEALLTVSTELSITLQPASVSRNVGSMAALRVEAGGALPISHQWFKGSSPIAGGTNATLWIPNLQASDDASTYHARVSNPWTNLDSDEATLTVTPRATDVPLTGYARVVKLDGPLAYWRLNEGEGSLIAVDAVGSFDGTYEAAEGAFAFGAVTGIPGETDPAVGVAGKARVVMTHALELNPQGPFTAEAWLKPNTLAVDNQDYRTAFSSLGSGPTGWLLYQQPNHTWAWVLFGNSWSISSWLVADEVIVANQWYHLVLTFDGSTFSVYVNGRLATSQAWSEFYVANKDGKTNLGWRSDNDWKPFDGMIDDVAFYNRALTPAQVATHYGASVRLEVTREGGNAVLSWPFGTLQRAGAVTGPYDDVSGASSPYSTPISGATLFYRVKM